MPFVAVAMIALVKLETASSRDVFFINGILRNKPPSSSFSAMLPAKVSLKLSSILLLLLALPSRLPTLKLTTMMAASLAGSPRLLVFKWVTVAANLPDKPPNVPRLVVLVPSALLLMEFLGAAPKPVLNEIDVLRTV